jgi:hypothetical protein
MSLVLFVTQGKNGMINTMIQSNQHFEKSVLVMMIHCGRAAINFADPHWAFTATDAMI